MSFISFFGASSLYNIMGFRSVRLTCIGMTRSLLSVGTRERGNGLDGLGMAGGFIDPYGRSWSLVVFDGIKK